MAISRSVVLAFALAACGTADEIPEDTSEVAADSIVAPGFVGPSLPSGVLPPLAVRGKVAEAPSLFDTTQYAAHRAQHSDGVDLAAPPDQIADPSAFESWITSRVLSVPNASYLQPPAIAPRLTQVVAASDTHMGELDPTILEDIIDVLADFPGFHSTLYDQTNHIVSWAPQRARWLDSLWIKDPTLPVGAPERHLQYPIPSALASFPDRGARLYCAAREVAKHQTDRGSLGEEVLLPLDILGKHLDIGVFDPVAFVNQPVRVGDTANDGANGFSIPFQLGVTIWPIRGLLPALPQVRYPLVFSSVDTEVLTDVNKRLIYEDQLCLFGPICLPIIRFDFGARFKTLAHTDTVQWASRELESGATFPLFFVGPMEVDLALALEAAIGKSTRDNASPEELVRDDRLMVVSPTPAGWPATVRRGGTPFPYNDGYWASTQTVVPGDSSVETFAIHSQEGDVDKTVASLGLSPTAPLRAAALADDDRHVRPVSELGLTAAIQGDVNLDFHGVGLHFHAGGKIEGALGLAHDIRDAVGAIVGTFGSPAPVQTLSITPETYGHVDFNINSTLDLAIPLVIKTINVHFTLIDKTIPVASFVDRWSDDHAMRIGTQSSLGEPTLQPTVTSHVGPYTGDFPSFPSVCLSDTTPVDQPPGACVPDNSDTTVSKQDQCFVTAADPQVDLCAHIPDESTDPAAQCAREKLLYACDSVSKQQLYKGAWVIAHKITYGDDDFKHIIDIGNACSAAEGVSADALDAWFAASFQVVTCKPDGTLVAPEDVVTSSGHGHIDAGRCH